MVAKRVLGAMFAFGLLGAVVPTVSEASFARAIGSGYGGKLSNNKSTKTQQLTADPTGVLKGSTSTEYDPSVVSLDDIQSLSGFHITEAYVGVTFDYGETEDLISLNQYENGTTIPFKETGYLQVFYAKDSSTSSAHPVNSGFTLASSGGNTAGDNTHTMFFNYIAVDPTTVANYRLYADDGVRGTSPDYLISTDDPNLVIRNIADAKVAAALVPLPAAFGPGLIGLGGVVIHRLRKRKVGAV